MSAQLLPEVEQLRHRWTVAAFHKMVETGLLGEDDRVELIEGELIDMAPIGSDHSGCVNRLNRTFQAASTRILVGVQNPVILDQGSEPQPDISVLRWRDDFYAKSHPRPEDILLLIEVADTTARYDREVKVPLYARHAIPEVWLLDLQQRRLEIYLEPQQGEYMRMEQRRTGSVSPTQLPEINIKIDDLLAHL